MKNSPYWSFFIFTFDRMERGAQNTFDNLPFEFYWILANEVSAQSQHKRFFPLPHRHSATSPPSICSNYALGASSEFHLCQFFRPAVFMRTFALTSWWVAALLKPTCGTLGWRWKEAAACKNKRTWCELGTAEGELSSLQLLLKVCLKSRVFGTNVSTLLLRGVTLVKTF